MVDDRRRQRDFPARSSIRPWRRRRSNTLSCAPRGASCSPLLATRADSPFAGRYRCRAAHAGFGRGRRRRCTSLGAWACLDGDDHGDRRAPSGGTSDVTDRRYPGSSLPGGQAAHRVREPARISGRGIVGSKSVDDGRSNGSEGTHVSASRSTEVVGQRRPQDANGRASFDQKSIRVSAPQAVMCGYQSDWATTMRIAHGGAHQCSQAGDGTNSVHITIEHENGLSR